MISHNFFNDLFVIPILNLLVLFHALFEKVHLPGAFGFAIIALTVFIRLILNPFFHKQLHTAKKMQELKPHLDKIQKKHKGDKAKLQQEQMKLYQQAGINPASGCLFMIIQIPIFIGLYQTLSVFLLNGNGAKVIANINSVLYAPFLKITTIDPGFLGFNLALSPQKAGLGYYYLIPVITAVLQYYQAQTMQPSVAKALDGKSTKESKDKKAEKTSSGEDFQKAMNMQMKYIFPLFIGWFAFSLPVGLSLYWNIFSIFSIIQYRKSQS